MEALYVVNHYSSALTVLNAVELLVGIFLLIPVLRRWQGYLIDLYGGFLFGLIPLIYLFNRHTASSTPFESLAVELAGCVILSVVLVCVHNRWKEQIFPPFVVVFFRIMLTLAVTIWEEAYSGNEFSFYLTVMLLSVVLSVGFHFLTDLSTEKWSRIICPIFGILEIAAAVMQFYRMDYLAYGKDFLAGVTIPFFLNRLGIDFWIHDDQYPYLFLVVGMLVLYGILACCVERIKLYRNYELNEDD